MHRAYPTVLLLAAAMVAACQGSSPTVTTRAVSPEDLAGLLPYDGPIRVLFDDSIDADAFSPLESPQSSLTDLRLVERIRTAAFVVPVTVVTVTEQHEAAAGHVDLELLPVAPPLHGSLTPFFQPDEPIKVEIPPSGAGYALVRANQAELIGKRLNLCWGRFVEDSTVRTHWHAFSDSAKTKIALLRAAAVVNVD